MVLDTLFGADLGDEVVRAAGADPQLCGRPIDAAHYFDALAHDHELACAFSTDVAIAADPDRFRTAMQAIAARMIVPRRYLVQALVRAIERGVRVWIVSASPQAAIEVAMAHLGMAPDGIIAARADGDGRAHQPLPVGQGKVGVWRQLGLPTPALAVGDSDWDRPLLAFADTGLRVLEAADDPDFHHGRAAVATEQR